MATRILAPTVLAGRSATTLFVKLLPLDPARRDAVAATGMGPREARFYRELAPTLAMRVPGHTSPEPATTVRSWWPSKTSTTLTV